MRHHRSKTLLLAAACMLTTGSAGLSCFGTGSDYANVDAVMQKACAHCHDPKTIDKVVADVAAIDDAKFTDENFPETWFRQNTRLLTVDDIIATANPATDADIDPKSPLHKAWLLHDFNTLQSVLKGTPVADFTAQSSFDAYILYGKTAATLEGCEVDDFLRKADTNSAEGMPPMWAKTVLEMIDTQFTEVTAADRKIITDYMNGVMPGGLIVCDWTPVY